jgi:uncharacterized membrane protein
VNGTHERRALQPPFVSVREMHSRFLDSTRYVSETERMMLVFGLVCSGVGTIALALVSMILALTQRDFSSPITAAFAAFTIALTCLVRYRMSAK